MNNKRLKRADNLNSRNNNCLHHLHEKQHRLSFAFYLRKQQGKLFIAIAWRIDAAINKLHLAAHLFQVLPGIEHVVLDGAADCCAIAQLQRRHDVFMCVVELECEAGVFK